VGKLTDSSSAACLSVTATHYKPMTRANKSSFVVWYVILQWLEMC